MPEARGGHVDLGAYVSGRLDPISRERFVAHLAGCDSCQVEERDLREVAELLRNTAPAATPAGMEQRTLAAVAAASGRGDEPGADQPGADELAPRRERRGRLGALAATAATAAAAGVAAALVLGPGSGDRTPSTVVQTQTIERTAPRTDPPGEVELTTRLLATSAPTDRMASARVRLLGIGRSIHFDSRDLPIIPKGQFYELWFVGPGDAPGRPNRISAGTFHPDEGGRSKVRFTAAVDPKKYPVLAVTREPGDGNPSPAGRDVLRSRN